MSGPLTGLRVLDASMGAVGPWAGALLGQLGADVLKLESPQGDFLRAIMPEKRGLSGAYITMNVNKRCTVLDLKIPAQREAVHRLASQADIFLENFRPGVADRIGVGYAELSALNPALIYSSACGFGFSGPMVGIGATDPHVQAFTGSTSVNGLPGAPLQRWRWYGHFDITTAVCSVQAILAALLERQQTGRGQHVRTTMVQAAMALQRVRLSEHLAGGTPKPMGSATTYLVPDQAFRTQDGWLAVSVTSRPQWRRFCEAIGHPDLAKDPRFVTNPLRVTNRDALLALLIPCLLAKPSQYWRLAFEAAEVPAADFTSFPQFRHHVHYRDNAMLLEFDTEEWGHLTVGGLPWDFSRTPGAVRPGTNPGALLTDGTWPAEETT
jgi:formyl-CoA transferase